MTCKHCLGQARRTKPNIKLTENLVGRVLRYSFGYSMTLNQFFIIERQTASSVIAREIGSKTEGYLSGYEWPDPTEKRDKVVRFYVRRHGPQGDYYFVSGDMHASLHDGSKVYYDRWD